MAKKDAIIKKWTEPDRLKEISEWAGIGYTDKQIAARMGISVPTLRSYRLQSPELDKAVLDGKEFIDYRVESALLKAALGGKTTEVKITFFYEKGQLVRTVKERITREQPPNVLACQTWLFNRQREKWKRNRDNEIAVDDDKTINIVISRAGRMEEEDAA